MKKYFIFLCSLFFIFNISANAEVTKAKFYECVDGDTAKVKINNKVKTLRFLAVDTPETKHPKKGTEPFGKEASNYTCNKLKNAKDITLEFDSGSDKTDKYDRLLVWVFVDNKLLQEDLINKGYAKVAYIYGKYKYTDLLEEKEKIAKNKKVGIWGDYVDYEKYFAYIILILLLIGLILGKVKPKMVYKVAKKIK